MKSKRHLKRIRGGIFVCLLIVITHVGQAGEGGGLAPDDVDSNEVKTEGFRGRAPQPRRGYPKELAFGRTPHRLMNIHVGTIESPPTALADLPRITEIDVHRGNAKGDDLIYDVTSWFPLKEMRARLHSGEERWVYYNQSNGYIIANADQFLKSSIYNFVSDCIEWSGFKPRLQVIYLEVSDEVELNFTAIQNSGYNVLLRGSTVLSFQDVIPEDIFHTKFSSSNGVKCEVSLQSGYYRSSYALHLKLNSDERTTYENSVFLAPNQYHINECGISSRGKRRVMVIKVDHVNYLGESLSFPLPEIRDINFDAGLKSSVLENPFLVGEIYKAYRVPVDFSNYAYVDMKNSAKMKDVTKILTSNGLKMNGFFDRSRRLLIGKGSAEEHIDLNEFVALLSTRYSFSKQCVLSFYEICSTKERVSKSWRIDDLLNTSPRKLGSIGSMLSYTMPAMIQSGDSKCEVRVLPPEEVTDSDDEASSKVDLQLKLKLDLPLLKLNEDIKLKVEMGGYTVIQVGEDIENNKLIMMVVKLRSLQSEPAKQ